MIRNAVGWLCLLWGVALALMAGFALSPGLWIGAVVFSTLGFCLIRRREVR